MPNPTDPVAGSAAELRDALAAVAEALDVQLPDDVTPEQWQQWLQERSDRATIALGTIEGVLTPGADVAAHVRYLREQIAFRSAL